MRPSTVFSSALGLVLCAAALGQGALDDARLDALAQRLGASSFEQREAAQRELEAMPPSAKPVLERYLTCVTDEEARARITQRIADMGIQSVTEMPGVTLRLRNAEPAQIVERLHEQTGIAFSVSEALPRAFYTLNADRAPLWEVVAQIARQHPTWVAESSGGITLISQRMAGYAAAKGMLVGVERPAIVPWMDPDEAGPPRALNLMLRGVIDPRISVISPGDISLEEVRDNLGNRWERLPQPPAQLLLRAVQGSRLSTFRTFWARVPEVPGERLTLRGEARYVVATEERTAVIEDVARHLNEPVALADGIVKVRGIFPGPEPEKWAFQLDVMPRDGVAPVSPGVVFMPRGSIVLTGRLEVGPNAGLVVESDDAGGGGMLRMNPEIRERITFVRMTDSRGTEMAKYVMSGDRTMTSIRVVNQRYEGPLKLEIRTTTRSSEVRVPFEITDVSVSK